MPKFRLAQSDAQNLLRPRAIRRLLLILVACGVTVNIVARLIIGWVSVGDPFALLDVMQLLILPAAALLVTLGVTHLAVDTAARAAGLDGYAAAKRLEDENEDEAHAASSHPAQPREPHGGAARANADDPTS